MADVAAIVTEKAAQSFLATWSGMAAGDVGIPIAYVGHADRTVQFSGSFNGATVTLEGSLDGESWATLSDAKGNALSVTAAGIAAVAEIVLYARPVVTGGSSPSVTVKILMRKTMG